MDYENWLNFGGHSKAMHAKASYGNDPALNVSRLRYRDERMDNLI